MPVTMQTICADALMEIGALAQGESLSAGDADFTLGKLNRLLDNWNGEHQASYAQQFTTFTLTPSLSPHTIGPTGTWVTTQRPVTIESLSLILSAPTSSYVPITLRDAQWWADQVTPTLASTFPTDCYYEPAWPDGSLYFWPVPETAYDVEVEQRVLLAAVALTDVFTLPPGYRDAITLTLAEECAPAFGRDISPRTTQSAGYARARIFANNIVVPTIQTSDAGMPNRRGSANFPTFNYLIGS